MKHDEAETSREKKESVPATANERQTNGWFRQRPKGVGKGQINGCSCEHSGRECKKTKDKLCPGT